MNCLHEWPQRRELFGTLDTIPQQFFVPGHPELQRGKKKRSSTCRNGYPSLPPKEPGLENLPDISSWCFLGTFGFFKGRQRL